MPFPALIPLLAKLGAGIGASLIGSKLAKSKPSTAEQQQLDLASQASKQGMETSRNLFDLGMPAARQALNYWSPILSGDRSRITSAMGPEISRIGEGYKAAGETSAALMPRGGPTPDFLSQQPYNQQRDVSTMFQQFRPQAAQQVGSTGSNLLTNAINALYSSTSAGRDVMNFESERRKRDREAGTSIGKTIFDIFYPAQGGGGLAEVLGDIFKGGSKVGNSTQNFPNLPPWVISNTGMRG